MKIKITETPDKYRKYINKLHNAYIRTTICPYCNSIDINKIYDYNQYKSFLYFLFSISIHTIFCKCRDCGTKYQISFKTPSKVGNLKPYFNILERDRL